MTRNRAGSFPGPVRRPDTRGLRPETRRPHAGASLRFLGNSARRTLGRCRHVGVAYGDLLHEGWLAWHEARAKGRSEEAAYRFAEHRMETVCERDWKQHTRPVVVDRTPSVRRLTPGQWRDLQAFLARTLAGAPAQLAVMSLLFHGRSIEEVARELAMRDDTARKVRSQAVTRLTRALSQ